MTNPCCGLAVIFCGFISLLIGRETINIPEIFSGVHGFMGMTVKEYYFHVGKYLKLLCVLCFQDLKFTSLENNEAPHPGIYVVSILIGTG